MIGRDCGWTVTVEGPCPVENLMHPACFDPGDYRGIRYQISDDADHAIVLVTASKEVAEYGVR